MDQEHLQGQNLKQAENTKVKEALMLLWLPTKKEMAFFHVKSRSCTVDNSEFGSYCSLEHALLMLGGSN